MDTLELLKAEMIRFDKGDAKRIQHFLKVHSLARLIGLQEGLGEHSLFVLESAALLHDIGIHPALEKYGSSEGHYQEKEGPAPATAVMTKLGYKEEDINAICHMIAHHHTYKGIDSLELQILIEADFLVNLYEDEAGRSAIEGAGRSIFRTVSGMRLLQDMFF